MKILNGFIMSRDKCVAEISDGIITSRDESLIPLYLKYHNNVEGWLESRAIDAHRTNSRLLKRALRLSDYDDISTVLHVHAATITDNYWFREPGSSLLYDDVRFKENQFDLLALRGDPDSFNKTPAPTPELTNTGSFEKCWRFENGSWWMYKSGNELESFSELFVYHLGKALGFDMAYYEWDGKYVKSRDFTDNANVNFEAIDALVEDGCDVYNDSFNVLYRISPDIAKQYQKLIYLDTVCGNVDRHTRNYGLLRDVNTGAVLSLAPNYDNNLALISRGYPKILERGNDTLIGFFTELMDKNTAARLMFSKLDIPEITPSMLRKCYDSIPIKVNENIVTEYVISGQTIIARAFDRHIKPDISHEMKW